MEEGGNQEREAKSRWEYETHFREYLLLLARRGKDGLESTDRFPKKIELSNTWHETLDKMREETKDGYERWALIGFRDDMRSLVLPKVFGMGERRDLIKGIKAHVPSDVMLNEFQRAKEKTGVVGLVGDIHSHPRDIGERIVNEMFGWTRIVNTYGGFSPGDLYGMVMPEDFKPLMAVVDGGKNYFVFKTRESTDIPVSSMLFTQETFEKIWHGKFGIKLTGKKISKEALLAYSTTDMNKAVARKHNLVLYKGHTQSDLEKIFP